MPNYSKMDEMDFVFIPNTPSEQEKKEISDFIRKDKAQRKSLKRITLAARKKLGNPSISQCGEVKFVSTPPAP